MKLFHLQKFTVILLTSIVGAIEDNQNLTPCTLIFLISFALLSAVKIKSSNIVKSQKFYNSGIYLVIYITAQTTLHRDINISVFICINNYYNNRINNQIYRKFLTDMCSRL